MDLKNQQEFVRLTGAANPFQAYLWEKTLRHECIRCEVLGDYLDAGIGDLSGVPAELWVDLSDMKRASAILRRHLARAVYSDANA